MRFGTLRQRVRGQQLALFVGDDGTMTAWSQRGGQDVVQVDVQTGRVLREVSGVGYHPTVVAARSFFLTRKGDEVVQRDLSGKQVATFAMPPSKAAKKVDGVGILGALGGPSPHFELSADGRHLATVRDRDIIVYDFATARVLRRLAIPPPKMVPSAAPSRGAAPRKPVPPPPVAVTGFVGDRLLVNLSPSAFAGLFDGLDVAIWDWKRAQPAFDVKAKLGAKLSKVVLVPNGDVVSVGEGMLRRHDASGHRLAEHRLSSSSSSSPFSSGPSVSSLLVAEDGSRIALQLGRDTLVFDGDLKELGSEPEVAPVALSAHGKRLVLRKQGFVHVRETDGDLTIVDWPPGHTEPVAHIAFDPTGKVMSTVDRRGDWMLWDLATGEALNRPKGLGDTRRVFLGAAATWVAGRSSVLRAGRGASAAVATVASDVDDAAFTERGFATVSGPEWSSGGIRQPRRVIWHDAAGAEAWRVEAADVDALEADDHDVLIAEGKVLKLIETATGRVRAEVEGHTPIALRPDRVLAGQTAPLVFERRGDDLVLLRRLGTSRSDAMAVSPDGRIVAVASRAGIDLLKEDGRWLGRFPEAHDQSVSALAFTPDGKHLTSGSEDGTVLLWDLAHLPPAPSAVPKLELEEVGRDLRMALRRGCTIDSQGAVACAQTADIETLPKDVWALGGWSSYLCLVHGSDRRLACWGRDKYGAPLGSRAVGQVADLRQLAMHLQGGCGVDGKGQAHCWGKDVDGGDGSTDRVIARDVRALGVGSSHGCLLHGDGGVSCWGRGSFALGRTTAVDHQPLTRVAGISDAVALAVDERHNCVVRGDGTVRCWGEGSSFQLGDGRGLDSATPVVAAGVSDAEDIVSVGNTTCTRSAAGALSCWGGNPRLRSERGVLTVPQRLEETADEIAGHDDLCFRRDATWSCL
ncbi:MAG: hypothetical protein KC731_03330 [Myxococcales bacterium]|nr:hypothetical protein [Myxococcales bacterium]